MVSLNILVRQARLVAVCALFVLVAPSQLHAEKCEANKNDGLTLYAPAISIYRSAAGLDGATDDDGGADATVWRKKVEALGEPLPAGGYYFQCKFDYAAQVLAERRKMLGDDHPYLHAWLRNQNAVFQPCSNWNSEFGPGPTLVSGFGDDVDALARADFAYQHAAWRYYIASRTRFRDGADSLKDEFAAIEADEKSPHRSFGAYMVALIDMHLSQAQFRSEEQSDQDEAAVLARVDRILGDPAMAPAYRIARQLRDILAYNTLEPELLDGQVDAMATALSRPAAEMRSNSGFVNDMKTAVADLHWFVVPGPANGPRSTALEKHAAEWPVLDWIRLYEAGARHRRIDGWIDPSSPVEWADLRAAALRRFEADPEPLWALPLAGLSAPGDERVDDILGVFDKQHQAAITCSLPSSQNALEAQLLNQAVRLLLERGETERAVTVLEEEAAHVGRDRWQSAGRLAAQWLVANENHDFARRILALFPARDVNVATLRQVVARNLTEFLDAVPDAYYPQSTGAVLNLLPQGNLLEVASNPSLPMDWRAAVARVAWTRALLLDGMDGARRVTPILAAVDAATGRALAKADKAWGSDHARRLAALALARLPGMNLDFAGIHDRPWFNLGGKFDREPDLAAINMSEHSDANWWCPLDPEWDRKVAGEELFDGAVEASESKDKIAAARERTLAQHPVLRLANADELARLSTVPSGPKFLAETAVDWARSSNRMPDLFGRDRGMAELLALAVKSTRYGCERAGGHGEYSRAAYEELHKRFPKDPRTAATKYWFNCDTFRLGCVGPYSLLNLPKQKDED